MHQVKLSYENQTYTVRVESVDSIAKLKELISYKISLPAKRQKLFLAKGKEQENVLMYNYQTIGEFKEAEKEGELLVTVVKGGREVSMKGSLVISYASPLIIFLIAALLNVYRLNSYYLLLTGLVMFHYSKRIFESAVVHINSNTELKLYMAFGLFFYYAILCGVFIPYEIYVLRDAYFFYPNWFIKLCTGLIILCELLNGYCHFRLREMRFVIKDNQRILRKAYVLPKGLFFDKIISPHYTFEFFSWFFFTILSTSFASFIFTVYGYLMMKIFAFERKEILKRKFKDDKEKLVELEKRGLIMPKLFG